MKMPQQSEDSGAAEETPAPLPENAERRFLRETLNVRSVALFGIFFLLILYTLKIASAFFVPVVLAIMIYG